MFEQVPGGQPCHGHYERADNVCGNGAHGPGQSSLLQQGDDFGGKRGEHGQPTAESGDDEQTALWHDVRRLREISHGQTDDAAADEIGSEGARRQGG